MTALPLALAAALAVSTSATPPIPAAGAAGVAAPPARHAAAAASREATAEEVPHLPGELMALDVSLGFLKAGEARISVGSRAGSVLPVFLESRTTGLVGLVKLRQHLVSNLDVATGLPRSSRLDGQEPGYRHTDTALFDREASAATVREVGRYDNTYRIEVPPGTLDFVALVFRLRTLPLGDGASHEFQVLAGRKVSRVVATVEGRERVKTPAGEFPSVKVRVPTGLTGKISEKSPTFIWFSDDERRVVVRISADFSFGRADALLTAYTPGRAAPSPEESPAGGTGQAEPGR
jgi:uncharacterized protein DUF3108